MTKNLIGTFALLACSLLFALPDPLVDTLAAKQTNTVYSDWTADLCRTEAGNSTAVTLAWDAYQSVQQVDIDPKNPALGKTTWTQAAFEVRRKRYATTTDTTPSETMRFDNAALPGATQAKMGGLVGGTKYCWALRSRGTTAVKALGQPTNLTLTPKPKG